MLFLFSLFTDFFLHYYYYYSYYIFGADPADISDTSVFLNRKHETTNKNTYDVFPPWQRKNHVPPFLYQPNLMHLCVSCDCNIAMQWGGFERIAKFAAFGGAMASEISEQLRVFFLIFNFF